MPCYQVNTVSLYFQAGNLELLQKAASVLGLEVRAIADRREVMDRRGNVATLVGGKATCDNTAGEHGAPGSAVIPAHVFAVKRDADLRRFSRAAKMAECPERPLASLRTLLGG
jgi:hypothetical protein